MLPREFCDKMQRLLDAEYSAFLAAYDQPAVAGLRINPLKTPMPPALPFSLTPVPWAKDGYYYPQNQRPGLHPWHEAGLYYLQEPSAMAPVSLLQPQPGERILDLCAAPGGKSTQIAAAMQNRGLLISNEIHPKRAQILSRNMERMGVTCGIVLSEHPAKLAKRFGGYFHRILVDAPCSGEGMFRREPEAAAQWQPDSPSACRRRQGEILSSAAAMLMPGGRLVYSTCTFSPEENEGTIADFLTHHPEFSLVAADQPWFSSGRPSWISCGHPELTLTCRLWPHKLKGEGHFAAVLQKQGGETGLLPPMREDPLPTEYAAFCGESLSVSLPGKPWMMGQTLCYLPQQTPSLDGLNVLRAGLIVGTVQKGRFIPGHALALHLSDGVQKVNFAPDSQEIGLYLQGSTLPTSCTGWTLVCAGGLSLGWAKGAGGTLKNHYPKGLRRH